MITCLAIDDEPLALRQLVAYISKVPFLQLVGECRSAAEAQRVMNNEMVDAIFVDINMPDLNGLDYVRTLSAPPIVVFTTAYAEYAIDGYKVDAADYLLKPFSLDDFRRAANKVRHRYQLERHADDNFSVSENSNELFFKTDHRVVRVVTSGIRYIEGMSEYVRIYFDDGKPLTVLLSMKKLEERLPKDSFMRIHRSYIVNLKKISEVNKNRVILDSQTYLPVGGQYKEAFNSYIDNKFVDK
jgi:two-component system LytT family response regulator